jgi:glyoxylase-like metal-dependent hydrolase (beta-lactamase superfamily II)
MARSADVREVRDGVFHVAGADVNWILLREGSDVTLIDAGYPGYVDAVESSIRSIGSRPEDVRAILLTHAHIDHMGTVNHFHDRYATPAYLTPTETAHAHRDYLEQAGELDVAKNIWRPGVLGWSLRITRAGATQKMSIPHAEPFPNAGALDLPGAPVPVETAGHTSGHCAYHLPNVGAVITGDGLVTGHSISRISGPQLLPAMFEHTAGGSRLGLHPLESLAADVILPGHGAPHEGSIAEAVALARERQAW